jgi:hypothetical protein
MDKITLLKAWISMEFMTWVFVMDVCMVNTIVPHFLWVRFSCKGNFWACAHKFMWSHGNISWEGKIFKNLHWWFLLENIYLYHKTKFGVLDKFNVFKALIENQIRKKIKAIICDGGGEYNFKNFNTFCKDNYIMK